MAKQVLSVGQCGMDHGSLSRWLQTKFDANVQTAGSCDEAVRILREKSFDLVLVNRIFDRDGSPGLEFIQQLRADENLCEIPMMLVSNYEDAQTEAVAAGARQGFGKGDLHSEETFRRVSRVLD